MYIENNQLNIMGKEAAEAKFKAVAQNLTGGPEKTRKKNSRTVSVSEPHWQTGCTSSPPAMDLRAESSRKLPP
jgi:hypothetical protein